MGRKTRIQRPKKTPNSSLTKGLGLCQAFNSAEQVFERHEVGSDFNRIFLTAVLRMGPGEPSGEQEQLVVTISRKWARS
jgi:hypothetical protein